MKMTSECGGKAGGLLAMRYVIHISRAVEDILACRVEEFLKSSEGKNQGLTLVE